MSIPEGYLPREGDVVVVHATVKYNVRPNEDVDDEDGPKVFIRPIGGYTDHRVPVKTLVGIYSRRFDEGDSVRPIVEPAVSGTVVATSDDSVWVKIDATETIPEHFETYRSENLEPVPTVDTSDIPETPAAFFEKATFVEPEAESAAPPRFSGGGIAADDTL